MKANIHVETESPGKVIEELRSIQRNHPQFKIASDEDQTLFPDALQDPITWDIALAGGPVILRELYHRLESNDDTSVEFTHENVDDAVWEYLKEDLDIDQAEAEMVSREEPRQPPADYWQFEFELDTGEMYRYKLYQDSPRREHERID